MMVYPSLEDMVVDHQMQGTRPMPSAPFGTIQSNDNQNNFEMSTPSLYPVLNGNPDEVSLYSACSAPGQLMSGSPRLSTLSSSTHSLIAPITSLSPGFSQANLTHGVRNVFVPKDQQGKIGVRFKEVNKGLFVQCVLSSSEASRQGIRFGDQILQINGNEVFGLTNDKAMQIIGKIAHDEGVVLTVRDRPYCRVITLHKDDNGKLGLLHKQNRVSAVVKDSSASRNGLTLNQAIIEVDGISVVAYDTKEIAQTLEQAGKSVALTILPWDIYQELVYKIDPKLLRQQDHSTPIVSF